MLIMHFSRPTKFILPTSIFCAALFTGCDSPFSTDDLLLWEPSPEQTHEISAIRLEDRAQSEPVTLEQATEGMLEQILEPKESMESLELSLEDVRHSALAHNLDLEVELINPTIAQTTIDEEESRFESVFTAGFGRYRTDSPVSLGTEGSRTTYTAYDLGVRVPLRTGGTINVNLPFSETETNNPFSLLDPSYTADLRFSISQPLLRGGWNRTNTYAIRVAKHQKQITNAQTKLEAIRILANVDRAYWRLYAAQRELEVRQQQYELAISQLERARRRVRAGDVAPIEVTRAESGVAQRLESIIIAETQIRSRQRELKRLINRPDLPIDGPTALFITTPPEPVALDLDPIALADFAVENRMEMLELELQLAIDASTIDLANNSALPLVTLDYAYTINGLGGSYNDAFDQLPDHSFEDWSVSLNAEIPIGNEAAKAQIHRAVLQRLQRLATKRQREQSIRLEVFEALDQLQQNWQRILAARQEVILAGRTYEAEQRQFDVGNRTSTDVLDAATNLADAQSREINALTDYQVSQVDIAYATGTLLGKDRIRWEPSDPSIQE